MILFSLLLHGYVGLRLLSSLAGGWADRWPNWRWACCWPLPHCCAALVDRPQPALAGRAHGPGMLTMGLFSSQFVLTVLRDVLLLASAAA